MTLTEIIRTEAQGSELRKLVILAAMAAAMNTFVLVTIVRSVRDSSGTGIVELLLVIAALGAYRYAEGHVTRRSLALLEAGLHRIRVRVGAALVRAELETLEQVEVGEICNRVTDTLRLISDHSSKIPAAVQSAVLLGFLAIYILWQSSVALTLMILLVVISLGLFVSLRREYVTAIRRSQALRMDFLSRIFDAFDGFKQLQFSARARRDLHAEFGAVAGDLHQSDVRSSRVLAETRLISGGLIHALLAAVAFVVNYYATLDTNELATLIVTALYLRKPVSTLSLGLLPLSWTNSQLAEISALEAKLEQRTRDSALTHADVDEPEDPWPQHPAQIRLEELSYTYHHHRAAGFGLGPLSLELERGRVVFVVGGNGSGKSTLFKVLAALYQPDAGGIVVDGVPVQPNNVLAYRERISAVFGDFHLFERLYGMPEVDQAELRRLLESMGIAEVVDFVDGAFTQLELSTGQRKRLALIVALLEDRPVLLLDEWAAEQDPAARRRFYKELLPKLREAGKIVIAISHDDAYFDAADYVVTMDEGRIRTIREQGART